MSRTFRIPRRALVVFAHPDDAEFGCAGTVAAWTDRGCRVTYCLLTSGNKGTHDAEMRPEQLASIREDEQRAAAAELGVEECVFLRHDDGGLEASMALRGEVCQVIREQKPELLIGQDPWRPYQVHPDHRVAGWAALDGLIAARDHLFFSEQLGPHLKHHRAKRALLFGTAEPNFWFDVSMTMSRKLRALRRHRSQISDPRTLDARLRTWARTQGQAWGLRYAEAFRYIELG